MRIRRGRVMIALDGGTLMGSEEESDYRIGWSSSGRGRPQVDGLCD
jgi:hypothetical protein